MPLNGEQFDQQTANPAAFGTRRRIMYHGSLRSDSDSFEMTDEGTGTHVGTRAAALDRLTNLAHSAVRRGEELPTHAMIHTVDVTARPSPHVYADPSLPSEESERRLAAGEGRWWQAEGDYVPERPVRYVNEYEDPGKMSLVVDPAKHVALLGSERIPTADLLKRTPSFVEH